MTVRTGGSKEDAETVRRHEGEKSSGRCENRMTLALSLSSLSPSSEVRPACSLRRNTPSTAGGRAEGRGERGKSNRRGQLQSSQGRSAVQSCGLECQAPCAGSRVSQ